jgi:hypothetical protein
VIVVATDGDMLIQANNDNAMPRESNPGPRLAELAGTLTTTRLFAS